MDYPLSNSTQTSETELTIRVYSAGGYTYVCEARPGILTSVAKWRAQRIDSSGNILWADGNTEFDNVADNYASLSYS